MSGTSPPPPYKPWRPPRPWTGRNLRTSWSPAAVSGKTCPTRPNWRQGSGLWLNVWARLRQAGFVERYNGPVLFEGQAAAELVNQILAPRLLALRTPIADDPMFARFSSGPQNPFLEKLGSRVLPRFLSVVDDPTAGSQGEAPLLGGYEVDEEGVRSRRTTVVQRGILKTLLATRTPVAGVSNSTGNRRNSGPSPSNLFLMPRNGMKPEEIRQELLNLVEERGLDFGIVVRRVGSAGLTLSRERDFFFPMPGEEARPKFKPLTEAYKVFPDGREELIRKAVLLGLSASSFREIEAASETLTPYHATFRVPMTDPFSSFGFMGPPPLVSLVVPSLLFEDLALRRPPGDIPPPAAAVPPLERNAGTGAGRSLRPSGGLGPVDSREAVCGRVPTAGLSRAIHPHRRGVPCGRPHARRWPGEREQPGNHKGCPYSGIQRGIVLAHHSVSFQAAAIPVSLSPSQSKPVRRRPAGVKKKRTGKVSVPWPQDDSFSRRAPEPPGCLPQRPRARAPDARLVARPVSRASSTTTTATAWCSSPTATP